ncbi:daptomycin-sensing surface protein LiaX [Vagococcus sp.]|uniref:daptomycin-sensing surface protein LiaX n=1 Tax=Vagococcus sp. TaxID=1933889 RepID=UPI003F97C339
MQERERILDLVKQGVLSTEEALVLLENIATEKDEKLVDEEAARVKTSSQVNETYEAEREEQYAKLLEEANLVSVHLDQVNEDIHLIKRQMSDAQEVITVIDTFEDLEEISAEQVVERETHYDRLEELEQTLKRLLLEKEGLQNKLEGIKKTQRHQKKDDLLSKFDLPEDWKEQTNETINRFANKMGKTGNQLGTIVKKTFETVSSSVNDNIDWKDINIKVPSVVTQSFTHEFIYPANEATILDIKLANGEVQLETWDQPDVKIEADIKLYGKMNAGTPLEAFLERSRLEVDDDKILVHIPNKRVRAELKIYLPDHMYDYLAIKMLNGDIHLNNMDATDVFLKTTNGDMTVTNFTATMVEVEGVNGEVKIKDSNITDFLGDLVNGDVTIRGNVVNQQINLINGDVRVTATDSTYRRIEASVVSGSIKVALPSELGVEGLCKTNFGNIKSRLAELEIIREKKDRSSQKLEMRRLKEEMVQLKLSTTTGNIYLKDTDSKN